MAKQGRYERIYILDMGDIIESVSNKASLNQLESNDLSPMQQTDLAASLMFDLIKRMVKLNRLEPLPEPHERTADRQTW